ncbi:conserved protein of unknown function [Bradyrhizobium vignae]|uniref:Nucleoside phosphorylase domain-containing protein n=2 Tax=Bradyrhizobium vignae TaxID=1549949 RepID=A0A2U3QA98_9BRAD|nr:conserved protein of unknown function [Bradyrhizobium vignae]
MQELSKRLANLQCQFSSASDYNSAVKMLSASGFDLVILDLLLPLGKGSPSLENSRTLISLMAAEDLFPAPHVIGLTEHESAAAGEKQYYSENMFALELFDWDSSGWADRISAKIVYLEKSRKAAIAYANNSFETDLLIVSARYENEYKPIFAKMKWEVAPMKRSVYFPGLECAIGRLVVDKGIVLRVVYVCAGEMGIAPATAITSHAVSIYRPRVVIALGMCCGFSSPECSSPSKFGDVLVSRETASWEEGKYAELPGRRRVFRNKSVTRTIDELIGPAVQACIEMATDTIAPVFKKYLATSKARAVRTNYATQMRDVPEVKYGMIVSGSSVIADAKQTSEIIARHPEAIGLEMEIFGVFTAVQKSIGHRKPTVIGIKGVADFGDGDKHDHIQSHASILAFYVMLALLRKIYREEILRPV